MCANIKEKKKEKEYESEPWIVTELRIKAEIERQRITDVKNNLKELFKSSDRPVIIFDECEREIVKGVGFEDFILQWGTKLYATQFFEVFSKKRNIRDFKNHCIDTKKYDKP